MTQLDGLARRALVTGVCAAALAGAAAAADDDSAAPGRERIVVVGQAADVADIAGSADLIDAEELQVHAYEDILRVLRVVPGVNIQEEDGFGLRPNIGLRGAGIDRSQKITLMEDGVLAAPAPYAAPEAYYFPHVGRMQAVEVVKGAGAIKYGPRTQGGSINLISTAVPDTFRALADVRVGDHDSFRAHAFAGGEIAAAGGWALDGLAETYQSTSSGFKNLDNGGDTGFDIEDYVGKLRLRSTQGLDQAFELKLQYSDELSNETYLGLTDADFAATPFRRYAASQLDQLDAEHSEISGGWFADFDNGLDVGVVVYRTDFARDWFKIDKVNPAGTAADSGGAGVSISAVLDDPGADAAAFEILRGAPGFVSADGAVLLKHNNRDYYAQGVQAVLGYATTFAGAAHDLDVGVRVHRDEMDRFQWYERFRVDNGTLVRTGADTPGTESNRVDSADAVAVYVQDTITIGRWTVTPGVRFETVDLRRENFGGGDPARTGAGLAVVDNSVDALVPGIGAVYDFDAGWSAFAGVRKGFAPPAPGRAGAEPEEATNWEAGVRWSDALARVEAVAFYNAYSNILGSCTASTGGGCDIGAQFDGGEVDVTGLELSGGVDVARFADLPVSLPVSFAYTYTSAEFQNAFESEFEPWGSVAVGDELPYIPNHQLSARFGVETDRWGGDVAVSYVDAVRAVAGQGAIPPDQKIEDHVVTDMSAFVVPRDGVRLTAAVRNVFDDTYAVARRPAGLRPGLPRTVLFGVTLDY